MHTHSEANDVKSENVIENITMYNDNNGKLKYFHFNFGIT